MKRSESSLVIKSCQAESDVLQTLWVCFPMLLFGNRVCIGGGKNREISTFCYTNLDAVCLKQSILRRLQVFLSGRVAYKRCRA